MSKVLRILFFGDIVGRPGRRGIAQALPNIKAKHQPDIIVANIENAAHGKGVTEKTLKELAGIGIDVFTAGEHIYDKLSEEAAAGLFAVFPNLVKPANFRPDLSGRGYCLVENKKGNVLVVNIIGQVFFRHQNLSPWTTLTEVLDKHKDTNTAAILVDLHAEATSEKVAMGQYFDGRVTAVLGTHTHIPTADASILPKGTAYVTDVGMNGPVPSVLGMKSEISIKRFLTGEMSAYEIAESDNVWLNYVIIDVDIATGKAANISHFHQTITLTDV